MTRCGFALIALSWISLLPRSGNAQDPLELPALPGAVEAGPTEGVTARLIADVAKIHPHKPFRIGVLLEVKPGYHTFYRSAGGIALPTTVAFGGPMGFRIGPTQFPAPEIEVQRIPSADGKIESIVEYVYSHSAVVIATVTPLASVPSGEVEFTADVSFQFCKVGGSCFPPNPQKLSLKLPVGSRKDAATPSGEWSAFERSAGYLPIPGTSGDTVKVFGTLSNRLSAPGDKAVLSIWIVVDKGWFIPRNRPSQSEAESTEAIVHPAAGLKFGQPEYPEPVAKPEFIEAVDGLYGYGNGQSVAVRIPVEATKDFVGGDKEITGIVRCQPFGYPGEKLPVQNLSFAVLASNAGATSASSAPGASTTTAAGTSPPDRFGAGSPLEASKGLDEIFSKVDLAAGEELSAANYLLFAFLGGLILNVMPCVLPVVAIKALSFVQQAGESRQRIFWLNVAYAAGVVSVFLVLATLAVTANLGWGTLFQKPEFNLVMAGIVFSMGLSLLGVFEIPLPGFVGASGGHKEGPLGAFMTGVFATFLATPCSAPFLGVALTWSLRQPPATTYLVWATMGVGMAAPYLVIGAFPATMRWLPKPGPWMTTFKEFSGLVLMATVIYLVTLVETNYLVPVLIMLVGLAVAFWMIGSLYEADSARRHKWTVRLVAFALAVATAYFAFGPIRDWAKGVEESRYLAKRAREQQSGSPGSVAAMAMRQIKGNGKIEFEPYSDARLKELVDQGKSVMIDFTADWCLTCHYVEATAINTYETEAIFEEYDMVALIADRTKSVPEIENALKRFGGDAIPFLVLIPGSDPGKAVVLKDYYTKSDLVEKIKSIGPSRKTAR